MQFLSKYEDSQLYLAKRNGISFGRSTSQGAESGNSLLLAFRKLPITSGLILFHEQDQERLLRNKKQVDNCTHHLPPKVMKDLHEKISKNTKHKRDIVLHNVSTIKIKSSRNNNNWHSVNLDNYYCSCCEIDITRRPCQHSIQASTFNNAAPEQLYHQIETTKHWQQQYEDVTFGDDCLVSIQDIKVMGRSTEQGPVATRRPKGRPKGFRRFKPNDEQPKPKRKKECL